MGITIHFEGRLKDEASFEAVLASAKQFCDEHSLKTGATICSQASINLRTGSDVSENARAQQPERRKHDGKS